MRGSVTRYKQEHKSDTKAQNPLDDLKPIVKLVFRSIGAGDEMKCLWLVVMFDIYQVWNGEVNDQTQTIKDESGVF